MKMVINRKQFQCCVLLFFVFLIKIVLVCKYGLNRLKEWLLLIIFQCPFYGWGWTDLTCSRTGIFSSVEATRPEALLFFLQLIDRKQFLNASLTWFMWGMLASLAQVDGSPLLGGKIKALNGCKIIFLQLPLFYCSNQSTTHVTRKSTPKQVLIIPPTLRIS